MTPQTAERRDQKKQFWIILIIVFLGFLGISMPYLIFPPLFLNPAYSFLPIDLERSSRAFFLGLTLAAYPLGQFIGSPILGALSDEYGRKHLISVSLVITSISNLFTGIAIATHHLGLLIITRFIAGLMEGNVAIARAMCADLKTITKHETFGKVNAITSTAYLIGPLLGAAIADKNLFKGVTTSTPFYLMCILFFSLAVLASCMLKKSVITASTKKLTLWERLNLIKRMRNLFTNKHLKILMVTSTCFTLGVDIFYEFGPVYLTAKWMLGPSKLILYNGIICFGLIIGNGWFPIFVSSRISSRLAILCAMGGFAILLPIMVFTHSRTLMMLCFLLSGIVIGLAVTLLTVKISDSVSDTVQGEVMGTQLSLRVLGDGIICLFGGILLILSSKIILIVASILSLATIAYSLCSTYPKDT